METPAAESSNDFGKSSLWVLPADCIVHVLSFDISNGLLNLILTGDKRIRNRLARTRHLSLSWEKSRYIDWRAASPLVRSIPQLESLRLTSSIHQRLSEGPPNAGIFSSSLRELILRYGGCARLLNKHHAPELFKSLPTLELFDLCDTQPARDSKIDLAHFPASLRSLCIGDLGLPTNRFLCADFNSLTHLPTQLETLHLHVQFLYRSNFDSWATPSSWTSLTDLSISLGAVHCIDLGTVGPRLKRLRVDDGQIKCRSEKFLFHGDDPIKSYFPVLELLHMERYNLLDWNQLRNLPPTLVVLIARVDPALLASTSFSNVLNLLNQECTGRKGVLQYAAPKNLLRLEHADRKHPTRISSALLQYFSSLLGTVTVAPNGNDQSLLDLPAINELCITKLDLPSLKSLPRPISSLKANRLVKNTPVNQSLGIPIAITSSATLPRLVRLNVQGALPIEVISMLPSSLQSLTFVAQDTTSLSLIKQRSVAGELPHLSSLKLLARASYGARPISINRNTVPSTLTTLHIKESCDFTSDASQSLRQHFRLKNLTLVGNGLVEVLPSLPPMLRTLSITSSHVIYLANPDDATTLLGMRQQLSQLQSFTCPRGWINAISDLNPPQVNLKRWLTLPWSLKVLYARFYVEPRWFRKDPRISSELFALRCLPRQLCVLELPQHVLADDPPLAEFWRQLLRDFKNFAKQFAQFLLKVQFPLLGLPWLSPRYESDKHHQVISALPPTISDLTLGPAQSRIQSDLYTRTTGFFSQDHKSPVFDFKHLIGPTYHIGNATAWILLALCFPQNWFGDRLLRYHMVTSALGSAITAPMLLWRTYKAGLVSIGNYRSFRQHVRELLVVILIPFVVNFIIGFLLHNVNFLRWSLSTVALSFLAFWFVSEL